MAIITWLAYREAQWLAAGEHLIHPPHRGLALKVLYEVLDRMNGITGSAGVLVLGSLVVFSYFGWFLFRVVTDRVWITLQPDLSARFFRRAGAFIKWLLERFPRPFRPSTNPKTKGSNFWPNPKP